jgi:hypothetical protein
LLPVCQNAVATSNSSWKNVDEEYDAGFCSGLVEGVIFGRNMSDTSTICPPEGVTLLQSMRVVVKYLEGNPAKLNLHESLLVELVLAKAFPCASK